METAQSILRSARSFFAGTVLSRASGLFRDIAMAISFGSSAELAAFFVAFRLANLFRRLLGEGNLQAGFVPHFLSLKEEGPLFYRDAVFSMGIVLLAAVALLEGVLWILHLFAGPDWLQIIELTMWMVPGLFFICLYALNSSFLQCRKKYFLPAAAPIAFNFIWVAAALCLPDVRSLAIAVTLAFAGQWFVTVFEGFKILSMGQWLKPKLFSVDFRALLKPLSLGLIGVGAVQFNSALDPIFARIADLQGPAFLWYAIRLQQLPLALFGIALSSALLPALSRTEDQDHRNQLLSSALFQAAGLMLFCSFAILALGGVGINLLYGHGDFTQSDVQETLRCLWGYGLGLAPSVFVLLLAARCFAEKNYQSPALASLFAVAINIALNALFVFVFGWGAVSVAIATSVSAFFNTALLARGAFTKSLWVFLFKMSVACLIPTALVFSVEAMWMEPFPRGLTAQVAQLAILGAIYLAGVALLCKALGLKLNFQRGSLQQNIS